MFPSSEYLFCDDRSLHAQRFHPLSTLKQAYLHLILNVFFALVSIGICLQLPIISSVSTLGDMLFCQTIFWCISLIFNHVYSVRHCSLRLRGYFSVHKSVENLSHSLFGIPIFFNVIIIIIQAVTYKYSGKTNKYDTTAYYLTGGIIIFEVFATIPVLIYYIVSVHKFNQTKPVPDIEQNEYFLPCDARSSAEIGYRLNGEAIADLLEKQSDLIYYLQSTIAEINNRAQ